MTMKSLFERRKNAAPEVRDEINSIIEDLMIEAKNHAKRIANPLTPEIGEEYKAELNLLAMIIGLESDEDWAEIREVYRQNLPRPLQKEST